MHRLMFAIRSGRLFSERGRIEKRWAVGRSDRVVLTRWRRDRNRLAHPLAYWFVFAPRRCGGSEAELLQATVYDPPYLAFPLPSRLACLLTYRRTQAVVGGMTRLCRVRLTCLLKH